MPDTNGDLHFDENTHDEYGRVAAASFSLYDRGRAGKLLSGPCPRCGHTSEAPVVNSIFVRGFGVPKLFRRSTGPTDPVVEPMVCQCSNPHPGRPDGLTGCGAFWTLTLTEPTQ